MSVGIACVTQFHTDHIMHNIGDGASWAGGGFGIRQSSGARVVVLAPRIQSIPFWSYACEVAQWLLL